MDNFKVIGVSQNASVAEIKRAFREKAKKYHPDMGGNKNTFMQLVDAYNEVIKEKNIKSIISRNHSLFKQVFEQASHLINRNPEVKKK